jgi:hypothetical protein
MKTQIMTFTNTRQSRTQSFNKFNELYGGKDIAYTMFLHKETKVFEDKYNHLNTQKEYAYVCKGELKKLLSELDIYNFSSNKLYESKLSTLKLKLTQKHFRDNFIRQPELRIVEGEFFLLTESQYKLIPFDKEPITSRRDIFLATKLYDRTEVNKELKEYIREHLISIKTNEEFNQKMLYLPIIKEGVENYVPNKVNQKAFELAKKHNLDHIEFNFLNFFYDTNKAMRNDNGQLFFDVNTNGIGWRHDRNWVKKKMKKLIDLGLVNFESRHDCRDGKYTSWYFYDADKNLDDLKHDF